MSFILLTPGRRGEQYILHSTPCARSTGSILLIHTCLYCAVHWPSAVRKTNETHCIYNYMINIERKNCV